MSLTELPFNINLNAKVVLTELGESILYRQKREMASRYPSCNVTPIRFDELGYYRDQMWSLMQTFGDYIYMGASELPFETEILLELEGKWIPLTK